MLAVFDDLYLSRKCKGCLPLREVMYLHVSLYAAMINIYYCSRNFRLKLWVNFIIMEHIPCTLWDQPPARKSLLFFVYSAICVQTHLNLKVGVVMYLKIYFSLQRQSKIVIQYRTLA